MARFRLGGAVGRHSTPPPTNSNANRHSSPANSSCSTLSPVPSSPASRNHSPIPDHDRSSLDGVLSRSDGDANSINVRTDRKGKGKSRDFSTSSTSSLAPAYDLAGPEDPEPSPQYLQPVRRSSRKTRFTASYNPPVDAPATSRDSPARSRNAAAGQGRSTRRTRSKMPASQKDPAGVDRTRPLYEVVHNDKKRVAYFYDSDIGNYAYVTGHPMKPHRIRLAHSLVMNYNVYKFLEIYRAKPAVTSEMTQFHTDEYIEFLQKVTPDNMDNHMREQGKYNVGDDCPVFDGLFEFCGISAGGSMEGAARLNREKCDIAINWAGGLHHAKKSEASGFCYVNDIVLAILELLRFKKRVLYIDIDVHHGDGVEEAFYTTDRVMTVSFHKYGEYFPGTGELRDIGIGQGKHYAVNFPLRDGIDDTAYQTIFEPTISAVMEYYQPEAVVLQCGGDSLSGDRLGCFNLSMRGHANCVKFVRSFGLPTLVLGGGGYTMRNVARTWAYETGRLVGVEMDSVLPYNEYYDYYGPDYELDVRSSNMENANSYEYLEKIKNNVIENLRRTAPVPSVQMQDIPRASMGVTDDQEDEMDDLDEDENQDVRMTQRQWEKKVSRQDEFEDSDDEDMAEANGVYKPNGQPRRSILDFPNPHAAPDDEMEVDSGVATPVPKAAEPPAEPAADNDDTVLEDADAQPAAAEPDVATKEASAPAANPAVAPTDKDGDVNMDDVEDKVPDATIKTEEVEGAAVSEPARKQTPLEGLLSALNDADPAKDAAAPATADASASKDGDEVIAGAEGDKKVEGSEPSKAEAAPSA